MISLSAGGIEGVYYKRGRQDCVVGGVPRHGEAPNCEEPPIGPRVSGAARTLGVCTQRYSSAGKHEAEQREAAAL